MQQVVWVIRVELDVVGIVGVGVNPDGILTTLEYATQNGS